MKCVVWPTNRVKMARTEMHLRRFLLLLCLIETALCYNLETRLPIVKDYPSSYGYPDNESYFGFSVAQHQFTKSDGSVGNLLVVGAPKLQTNQENVKKGGGLFSCPVSTLSDDCTYIDIDPEGNLEGENKTDQWFGVTVKSSGKDGPVLACAHRYKKVAPAYRYGYGRCFLMELDTVDETFKLADEENIPVNTLELCKGRTGGNEGYGYCQSGTDAEFSKDSMDVIIGAPGSIDWRGVLFATDITGDIDRPSGVFKSGESDTDSTVLKFSYLGISVATGIFNGEDIWFVAGAPGHNVSGAVVLFAREEGRLVPKQTIYSEQLASSFGYDVDVADFNGDGYDDLVVGSPLYYEKKAGIGGRVFVYMNAGDGTGRLIDDNPIVMSGVTDSMFGITVSTLRDLDSDGYEDIAVGAPYENDGQGAVYIYQGGPDGVRAKYSQKITPADLPDSVSSAMKTFGYSLNGVIDVDDNSYPDLVIGMYESSKVVLLRSRPVLSIMSKLSAKPMRLNHENENCTHQGKDYACFDVHVCLKYNTTSSFEDRINVDYTLEVEKIRTSRGLNSRVFFADDDNRMHKKSKKLNRPGAEKCDEVRVFVYHKIKDILNPIDVTLSYSLPETDAVMPAPGDPLPSLAAFPVLNMTVPPDPIQVDFFRECGDDNKCDSDMSVMASYILPGDPPVLSLGTDTQMAVKVEVRNSGESAYQANYVAIVPESLEYVGYDRVSSTEGVVLACDQDVENTTVIECDLGNPLPENAKIEFHLRFKHDRVNASAGGLTIDMFVETTSDEVDTTNDRTSISAKVEVVTDLHLYGQSVPSTVSYSGVVRGESAMEYEDEIGHEVLHVYVIQNKGRGDVNHVFVTFRWPYEVANGKWLLYMTEYPQVNGPGSCSIDADRVNFLQVKKRGEDGTFSYQPSELNNSNRRRRDVDPSHDLIGPTGEKKGRIETLSCDHGTARCFTFNCTLGPLKATNTATVTITSRLWNSTFLEDYRAVTRVNIVSRADLKILNGQYIRQTDLTNDRAEVTTEAAPDIGIIETKKGIPIWIYIVAALAGLILLIIVVLILWRCGFFKRKRVGHNTASFRGTSRSARNGEMERKPSYKYEKAYQDERYN